MHGLKMHWVLSVTIRNNEVWCSLIVSAAPWNVFSMQSPNMANAMESHERKPAHGEEYMQGNMIVSREVKRIRMRELTIATKMKSNLFH